MNIEFIVPQVLIETNAYRKAVNDIWDEDEQTEFKNYIGSNPYAGVVIPGTGGIEKYVGKHLDMVSVEGPEQFIIFTMKITLYICCMLIPKMFKLISVKLKRRFSPLLLTK